MLEDISHITWKVGPLLFTESITLLGQGLFQAFCLGPGNGKKNESWI